MTGIGVVFFDSGNYTATSYLPTPPRVNEIIKLVENNGHEANYVVTEVNWNLIRDVTVSDPVYRVVSVKANIRRVDEL